MVPPRHENSLPSTLTGSFRSNPRLVQWLLIAAVLGLSALYAAHGLKRGWVPADEGFLGQSAERVLHGELPHREYSEGYTGGLTFLNAAAFQLLGTNLASLRYVLFLFFLLWVPAFLYSATHFVSTQVAAALTLLAVAWSIPNYPAALPSWYNLFFATFGLAAVLRYLETEHRGWLFAAGVCGGISFLFKLTGLYFVAGVLLFLLFRECMAPGAKAKGHPETIVYRIFLLAAVLFYEALVFAVLQKSGHPAIFLYFWVPELAIGATILWLEFYSPESRSQRFLFLFRELMPFAAGIAVPLAIFLGRYVLAGSESRLHEILTFAGRQLDVAVFEPSLLKLVGGVLLNLMLIAAAFLTRGKTAKAAAALFMLGIPVVLLLAWRERYVDRAVWGAIWTFLPVVVVFGAVLLARSSLRSRVGKILKQKIFLVLSVTAACSLIQFPFAISIYFCYVAPLAFLAAAAVCCLQKPPRWIAIGALCLCLAYVVLEVTPGFIEDMGEQYSPDKQTATLTLPRAGGLRGYPGQIRIYEELATILKQHTRGEYIYATPDCPEVYFLNGFRNPTPTLFDLADDPVGRTERILQAIRQHGVNLVVLNAYPQFSAPVPADLRTALESEFPNRAQTGKFEVRWKP
jgi:hypothetical protein